MRRPILGEDLHARAHSVRRGAARAALVVLALACPDGGLRPAVPERGRFYRPPSPLPAGSPGDVIRVPAEPRSRSTRSARRRSPTWPSQQVLYRSTDALGQPMAVSGTVLVPTAPWTGRGSRPLVSYAVGTRGVGDDCAPVVHAVPGRRLRGLLHQAAARPGLGGRHQRLPGPRHARACTPTWSAPPRATPCSTWPAPPQRLPGTGLSTSTPVGLMGYSQGGGAAGWAAELGRRPTRPS